MERESGVLCPGTERGAGVDIEPMSLELYFPWFGYNETTKDPKSPAENENWARFGLMVTSLSLSLSVRVLVNSLWKKSGRSFKEIETANTCVSITFLKLFFNFIVLQ